MRNAGVAPEVLVGEEQHARALAEGPVQDGARVGGGADGAAVAAHERLQGGRRVHVGDGEDVVPHDLGHDVPAVLDLVGVRHVRHRAAGVEVGQDDLLVRRRTGCPRTRP